LDSKKKAKDVVIYQYKHATSRFSVKFTPQLVEELKSEPPPPLFMCSLAQL
jgi:ribosome maturation protein Sdo1